MYRLLAYLYLYNERLEFTKGISTTDKPDIWLKNYSGEIELWIELGLPEPKRIKQALSRSSNVAVFTYQPQRIRGWESKVSGLEIATKRFRFFYFLPKEGDLVELCQRTIELSCIIEDGLITLASDTNHIQVRIES